MLTSFRVRFLTAAFVLGGSFSSPTEIRAAATDVILEWNAVALDANAVDHTGPGGPGDQLSVTQGPVGSARALAMVHAAMFDAYNSVDPRYSPYRISVPLSTGASIDAAVAQAAHDTLLFLYPNQSATFAAALKRTLDRVPNSTQKYQGIAVGKSVSLYMTMLRLTDGASVRGSYTPTGQPGNHDVDPLHPNQGFITPAAGAIRPFVIASAQVYRAVPPPNLTDAAYTAAWWEVALLGGDGVTTPTLRTAAQTDIAIYWSYDGSPLLGTPPRMYNQIARVVAQQRGNAVHENARLFALLNLAMADAGISCWETKYVYKFWRPIRGIRFADTDSNPSTPADPTWSPLGAARSNPFPGETNFTPAFPAYTSGHSTFGAAAFKVLANFYQRDAIPFTFISDEYNGSTRDQSGAMRPVKPRSFSSFSQASAENAASRIFNGVHWRFDSIEGVRAGNRIADYTYNTVLRPYGLSPKSIPDANFAAQINAYLTGAN